MTSNHSHKDSIECPDPSAHSQFSRDHDLQNNASKAALLAAASKKTAPTPKSEYDVLGPDGRLSSAGAAASLKYAKAQDLPGFPIVGIEQKKSGNTAANLAFDNQKPFEWWEPEKVELSSAAGKAATMAAEKGGDVEQWKYKPDGTGNSAASIAMGRNSSPQLDYGYTDAGHKNSLLAATRSLRISDHPVQSIGTLSGGYPDADKATSNALNAATIVHRNSVKQADANRMSERAMEASRVTHTVNVPREQYGSTPTSKADHNETTHQAALRASAVSMAKSLYELEKPAMERIAAGDSGARKAYADHQSATQAANLQGDPLKVQAMNYMKVQEMAQKLANERLAKLDPDGVLAYREHYGYGNKGSKSSKNRPRAASNTTRDDLDSSDDEATAARIRSQQRGFESKVEAVDLEKRANDRKSLLAAAQRSVQARMSLMDEKVFADTGKVSPAMMAQWEAQAQAKAAANSEERMLTHGKVHIGGNRYMDQSEIDAIAAARMQPILDEVSATAEAQRIRDAEIITDKERREEAARLEKQRQADLKAEQKRVKSEEKASAKQSKEDEKAAAKRAKEEGKARIEEMKRQQRAEKLRGAKEREALAAAGSEQSRLHKEHLSAEEEAERARKAEQEALEREKLADERIAAAEREMEEQEAREAAAAAHHVDESDSLISEPETEVLTPVELAHVEPRGVTSAETDRSNLDISPDSSTNKHESKLHGLFSRITHPGKSTSETEDPALESGEKFKTGTGDSGLTSAEMTERARESNAVDVDDDERTVRGRSSLLTESTEQWEEARDKFDAEELAVPKVSGGERVAGSPARSASGSKFQEEL